MLGLRSLIASASIERLRYCTETKIAMSSAITVHQDHGQEHQTTIIKVNEARLCTYVISSYRQRPNICTPLVNQPCITTHQKKPLPIKVTEPTPLHLFIAEVRRAGKKELAFLRRARSRNKLLTTSWHRQPQRREQRHRSEQQCQHRWPVGMGWCCC